MNVNTFFKSLLSRKSLVHFFSIFLISFSLTACFHEYEDEAEVEDYSSDGGEELNCEVYDVWSGSNPELDTQAVTTCQAACAYGGSSTSEGESTCGTLEAYGPDVRSLCTVC